MIISNTIDDQFPLNQHLFPDCYQQNDTHLLYPVQNPAAVTRESAAGTHSSSQLMTRFQYRGKNPPITIKTDRHWLLYWTECFSQYILCSLRLLFVCISSTYEDPQF